MDSGNTDIFQKYIVLTLVSLHVNMVYLVPSLAVPLPQYFSRQEQGIKMLLLFTLVSQNLPFYIHSVYFLQVTVDAMDSLKLKQLMSLGLLESK